MWKRYWNELKNVMAYSGFAFLALILIFRDAVQTKHYCMMLCVGLPIHLFAFFIFELRLFSRHLWVRRGIAIGISILVMLIVNFLFDNITSERFWPVFGICVLIVVVLDVFFYYVSDMIEKRNLDAINQKLAQETEKNEE